jgi:hypothetical protein
MSKVLYSSQKKPEISQEQYPVSVPLELYRVEIKMNLACILQYVVRSDARPKTNRGCSNVGHWDWTAFTPIYKVSCGVRDKIKE